MTKPTTINLRDVFLGLQDKMIAELRCNRASVPHPGTKGDATELCWRDVLNHYLPKRYQAEKAFVIDADGGLSEQIDIVVFDRQYSPFLFNQGGAVYVPAESVYAVVEVKQELTKEQIEYAAGKAASVRRRRRTTAVIHHAGGQYAPKKPFDVLAGIVTLGSQWNPPLGPAFEAAIKAQDAEHRLDLGCALEGGAFEVTYPATGSPTIRTSQPEDSLITFFLRLLARLQQLGTVPAMDIAEYERCLSL